MNSVKWTFIDYPSKLTDANFQELWPLPLFQAVVLWVQNIITSLGLIELLDGFPQSL